MLEVKGPTVVATPLFVREKHGDGGYQRWLAELPEPSRQLYTSSLLPTRWYPVDVALVEPHRTMTKLFSGGSDRVVRELGRFSADYTLTGVYKIFVKMGSPHWLVKKCGQIFSTFYRPGSSVLVKEEERLAVTQFRDFPEKSGLVEVRIAGWVQRALEISGQKGVQVQVTRSVSRGDDCIELTCTWN